VDPISCHHVPRTVASLRRYKSLTNPVATWIAIFDCGPERCSTPRERGRVVDDKPCNPEQIPLLHQLLVFPRPSMKQLHIYSERQIQWDAKEQGHDIPKELPSLRELFIRFSVSPLIGSPPNLVHLALEDTEVRGGCIPINFGCAPRLSSIENPPHRQLGRLPGPNSRSLPRFPSKPPQPRAGLSRGPPDGLPSIPPKCCSGLPETGLGQMYSNVISPVVMAAMQHVLGRIDIHRITLARHIPLGGT
jgi:hypothetical protein